MDFATLQSLHKVISSCLKISFRTTGLLCSRAQALAADFFTKNTMVSLTIRNVINPGSIKEFPMVESSSKIYDFPSACVLIRTLFEGYINMNYLLIDSVSDEERKLRLDLWDRHGLLEGQRMASPFGFQHKKLETEEKQIDAFTKSIENSYCFKTLSKSKRQSFLNMHKWTTLNTMERADKANIHRSQSELIFKFLSNYAHSESYALMQIRAVDSVKTAQKMMRVPLVFTEMFLSLTLKLFTKLQPIAKSMIEGDRQLFGIMDFWEDFKTKDFRKLSAQIYSENGK